MSMQLPIHRSSHNYMNILRFAALLILLATQGRAVESTVQDTVVVEAVGIGAGFDKAVEAACRNAIRQATVVSLEENRRTMDESVTRDEDFSYTETTRSEILTSSEGQIVGYDVLEAKPVENGEMEVRIRATIRTPEALKRNFEAVMREGMRLCKERKFAASIAAFEQAQKIPGYAENEYVVQWLAYARRTMQNQARYAALMNNAVGQFNAQQYDEAEQGFRQVFLLDGYGNDRQARQWLERTQTALVDEKHEQMSLDEGITFYRQGDYQAAATAFRRAFDDMEAQRWLERTEEELFKIEAQQAQYNAVIDKIQAHMQQGGSDDYNAALMETANALAVYPNDPGLLQLKQQIEAAVASKAQQRQQVQKIGMNLLNSVIGGIRGR